LGISELDTDTFLSNNRKRKFQSQRPRWVDPTEHLPPEFQNLFQLSYFTGTKELVPVGWGTVDEDKEYPKISSRSRHLNGSTEENNQYAYSMANGKSHSEASSDDDDSVSPAPQITRTRMTEESSDEDDSVLLNHNTRVCLAFTSCVFITYTSVLYFCYVILDYVWLVSISCTNYE
jgi:hypothetical protein